ncbi:MAG: tetratricopeptide repeat protein [Planctomycetes bacterium]|nr:tetratricopeptide repeat protein [Planctomycetota bacterium]
MAGGDREKGKTEDEEDLETVADSAFRGGEDDLATVRTDPSPASPGAGTVGPLPARAGDPPDEAGLPFGGFRLLEEIGRGGMGIVWKAWDTRLRRIVAVKQILPKASGGAGAVERFLREARSAARLRHTGIVTVHEIGVADGEPFITMELVEGKSLARHLGEPRSPREAAELARDVALALQHAHEHGVVHRDVKPGNILLDGSGRPHLTDFGLAKDLEVSTEAALTASRDLLGTPRYMSPEQVAGGGRAVGPASDQFSLGAILYELLAGRPPFSGDNVWMILTAVAALDPTPPSVWNRRVPRDLEAICLCALEKDPRARYPSIGDLAQDLERFLDGRPVEARPLAAWARLLRRAARHRASVLWAAAAVLSAATLGAVLLRSPGTPERTESAPGNEIGKLERARARDEAYALMEEGRPALDDALQYFYEKDARPEELVRRVEASQARLEEAARLAPDLALGHHLVGRAWALRGYEDHAEASWKRAIEIDADFAPPRFELGRLFLVRAYLASIAAEGADPTAWAAGSERFASRARDHFEKAASHGTGLDGEMEPALADAMLAYARMDRELLRRLLAQGIEKFEGRHGVEEFHWLAGATALSRKEAFQSFDRALAIRPHYPIALFTRASILMAAGDYVGAIEGFRHAIRIQPRFAWAHQNLGEAFRLSGDLPAAIESFGTAIEANPSFREAFSGRADVRERMGDIEGALADWTEAIRVDPTSPDPRRRRIQAFTNMGKPELALPECDEALQVFPGLADLWLNRGVLRQTTGDLAGAASDYDGAIRLDPELPEAHYNRGSLLQGTGDLAGAVADYDAALAVRPGYYEARTNRALSRAVLGDIKGATLDLERALSDAPADWPHRARFRAILEELRR